ncbi:hypothetical protein [Anaerovibrio lipolyticus]|uniref:hypothetical protein n=1 Tax=Anaerovibrio lipolyticus TaxID=82374 RepID=UPI00048A0210|nr:hypothetical protein [Anaerovibrio lipolyticus]
MAEKDKKDLEQSNKSTTHAKGLMSTEELLILALSDDPKERKKISDLVCEREMKRLEEERNINKSSTENVNKSTITDRDIMEYAVDLFIDALPNLNERNSLPKEASADDRRTKEDVFSSLKDKD